jgi:hypothetical protein
MYYIEGEYLEYLTVPNFDDNYFIQFSVAQIHRHASVARENNVHRIKSFPVQLVPQLLS